MTDIVERWRRRPEDARGPSRMDMLRERAEAADEIEQLRAERDAADPTVSADDLVQRLRDRLAAGCNYMEDGSVMPDAETRITRAEIDEIERLRTIAGLARKARWIGAACWDLADGSGCFISAESMKRFDEVFNELGVALGETIPIDEEDERAQFDGPAKLLERAKAAEAERDALRKRIESAPLVTLTEGCYGPGGALEIDEIFIEKDPDEFHAFLNKRVRLVIEEEQP